LPQCLRRYRHLRRTPRPNAGGRSLLADERPQVHQRQALQALQLCSWRVLQGEFQTLKRLRPSRCQRTDAAISVIGRPRIMPPRFALQNFEHLDPGTVSPHSRLLRRLIRTRPAHLWAFLTMARSWPPRTLIRSVHSYLILPNRLPTILPSALSTLPAPRGV
jgi:hypothetical protein